MITRFKKYNNEQLYWKVYTKNDPKVLSAGLFKIDIDCLDHFLKIGGPKGNIENKISTSKKFIWIYKDLHDALSWEWDSDSIKNPEDEYENLKFMGDIIVNNEDMENYEIYISAKKYNL